MQIEPPADAFAARYARGEAQVVWTELVADLETPVSAFLKIAGGRPMSFLLESVEGGAVRGRYSVIGLDPDVVWRARGERADINRTARTAPDAFAPCAEPPLAALRALIAESRIDLPEGLPPMAAGVFGYLGYDTVRLMEELPQPNPDPIGLSDAILIRPSVVVVFDAVRDAITVVTPVRPEPGVAAKAALARAEERLSAVVDALERPLNKTAGPAELGPLDVPSKSNTTPDEYRAMVLRAKEYILAGDIFQVVLSQRFTFTTMAEPLDIYRTLRQINPSPYMYFVREDDLTLVGCSPEPMVQLLGGQVISRPIAGTRFRGRDDEHDRLLAAELLEHPKERSEHLMLVDLARNDVGRVVEFGTCGVDEFMTLERYSHVMHLTSQVSGTLAPGRTPIDVLRATLPAGTVSGAPKVRAMEIIDALEPTRRGPYAGVVGYLDFSGNIDTAIAIRTMIVEPPGPDGRRRASVQAGAGVVADSDPADEELETRNKAKALLSAVPLAERITAQRRAAPD